MGGDLMQTSRAYIFGLLARDDFTYMTYMTYMTSMINDIQSTN